MKNAVRAAACALLVLSACGPEAPPAPAAPSAAAPKASPAGGGASALALPGPGAPAHELYAARGISCEACHPCGERLPGGHEQPWMDGASAGFHAFSANSGLSGCTVCHGPALDGAGGSVSISCAQCHGASWRTDCSMCHGSATNAAPPDTTFGRSGETVRVGAHQAHLGAAHGMSAPVACSACHVVPADALSPGHADGPTADVDFSGLAGAGGGWDRTTATCTSTYCHSGRAGGTVPAPVWTRASGADRACDACHGAPPPAPGHPENSDCGSCHPGYTAGTVAAATHVNGLVEVDGAGVTCSSCHGSEQNAAPPSGTRGETLTTQLAVGAHQRHVAGGTASGPIGCDACHFGFVPTENRHANLTVDVAFSPAAGGAAARFERATGTCTTTCHGSVTPVWTQVSGGPVACNACHGAPPARPHPQKSDCGACHIGYGPVSVNAATHLNGQKDVGPMACNACHGSAQNAAPPAGNGDETLTTARAVGAHQAHLAASALGAPMGCATCHPVPATARHYDGSAVQVLASAGWNGATCTNACHGAFAPVWTQVDGTQAACGTCHRVPPLTVRDGSPHTQNPACGNCHDGYTMASANPALHLNGVPDVKPLVCSSCHGSELSFAPPLGLAGETLTTEPAVGAHQAHLVAGTLSQPVSCQECHEVPTSLAHADGTLQLPFGTLARSEGAAPVYDPVTGTCASTYCHGATLRSAFTGAASLNVTPFWTGGPGQAACGACHLLPPPQPHPRTQLCDGCHPGYSLTGVNLATHIDGAIQAENLSCSVCHGDDMRVLVAGADGRALAAPPYGTRGETSTATRAVGAHQAHVNRGDGMALPAPCETCHDVPTAFDHADGQTVLHFGELATMGGASPSFDGTTCSNTYCHGSTLNRGGTSHTPTWAEARTGPLDCTTCHGAPPPSPHPQDSDCIRCHPGYTATSARRATHVNGISDFPSSCNACHDAPPNSGKHYRHVQRRIECDRCHQGYTRTTANEALHRNARQDVTLSGWDAQRRTCSNVSCHWRTEYWGRTAADQETGCNRCHGIPPSSGEHAEHREYRCDRCHGTGYSSTTVNAATHMNGTVNVLSWYDPATLRCDRACHGDESWRSRGTVTANCTACHGFPPPAPHPQRTACHDCHTSMNSDGTLTDDHNNGSVNLSGTGCATCHGYPPTTTRTGATHTTDQNCYGCHSTTVDASNNVAPNGTHNDGAVQVGGGGVGTYGCQTCHGDQARAIPAGIDPHVKSAPPIGTRGETLTTERAVGAHQAHLARTAGLARPLACGECHPVPIAMDHANGSTVMAFGTLARTGGASPSFDGSGCASTYCHGATLGAGGTNHTPAWTAGPSQAACGTCHASPPPAPHTTSTQCGACHAGYTATTVNAAVHVDGKLDVTAQTCGSCHAIPPPAPHTASTACGGCHTGYTATTVNDATHLDGTVDVSAQACGSCHAIPPPAPHTASTSCGQCHAGYTATTVNEATHDDGIVNTSLTCTSCHGRSGQAATAAAPLDAAPPVDTLAAATGLRVGAHQKHLLGGSYSNAFACQTCHASVGTYTNGHTNGTNDVGFTGAANANLRKGTWTPRAGTTAGSCASTWCHGAVINRSGGTSGGTATRPSWNTSTITTCTVCHAVTGSSLPNNHTRSNHRVACSTCHGTGYTSTTGSSPTGNGVNKPTHVDGVKTIFIRTSGTGIRSWNPTTRTCTASCHGSETW